MVAGQALGAFASPVTFPIVLLVTVLRIGACFSLVDMTGAIVAQTGVLTIVLTNYLGRGVERAPQIHLLVLDTLIIRYGCLLRVDVLAARQGHEPCRPADSVAVGAL
jgi:hypothetical protein